MKPAEKYPQHAGEDGMIINIPAAIPLAAFARLKGGSRHMTEWSSILNFTNSKVNRNICPGYLLINCSPTIHS